MRTITSPSLSCPWNFWPGCTPTCAGTKNFCGDGAAAAPALRTYVIGGLELCEDTAELTVDGTPVKLTPLEFKILALLMKNPGRVFSAEEIYERVWNERAVSTDTIMVHIRNIREKIEYNPREPKYLKVVWGIGYKIEK